MGRQCVHDAPSVLSSFLRRDEQGRKTDLTINYKCKHRALGILEDCMRKGGAYQRQVAFYHCAAGTGEWTSCAERVGNHESCRVSLGIWAVSGGNTEGRHRQLSSSSPLSLSSLIRTLVHSENFYLQRGLHFPPPWKL
jgi:hypothetical protein